MFKLIIILFIFQTSMLFSQVDDSVEVFDYTKDVPGWLKEKIKTMSIDEKHYAGTKVFRYQIGGEYVYWINNPWSSCMYCELFYPDGTALSSESIKEFVKQKDEPLLIWQNYPAVPFDSLNRKIRVPDEGKNEE